MRFHHNKQKQTTRLTRLAGPRRHLDGRLAGLAVVLAVLSVVGLTGQPVSAGEADDVQSRIKALESQIDDYNKRSSQLAEQSTTLQGKIAELQNQQAEIQTQIDLSQAQRVQLEQQIATTEAKIKAQTEALSQNLQAQYYSSQTSSLDMIMNSNSVSDYVDRQTRQQSMGDQISKSVTEIKQLRADLLKKKTAVEQVIKRQNAQKQDLADSQAEQQKLLEETQGQEAKFKELTEATKQKLEEQRRILNDILGSHSGVACGGGYPTQWCSLPKDAGVDSYGMYTRECVSYAAFRVDQAYGWPKYWTRGGNDAKNWLSKARAYGIPTGTEPKVGSVAVLTAGSYGHVAWVESVDGNKITISDYNSDLNGNYSRYSTKASNFTGYIYFDQMPK